MNNPYAKQQEYRLIKNIKKYGGTIVEYYGSRQQNKGDVLANIDGMQIRFDHKSTENPKKFIYDLQWMPKLLEHCNNNVEEEGISFPVISFSIKGNHDTFVCSYMWVVGENFPVIADIFTTRYNEIWLGEMLYAIKEGDSVWPVRFDHDYDHSIGKFYTLKTFMEGVKGL